MKSSRSSTALSGRTLKHLLARLCDCAHQDVTRLRQHEEVAVHQLRLRMKKVEALLRLAAGGIESQSMKAMRVHLRAVKNACALSRNDTVRHKLIDKLVNRHHLHVKTHHATPEPRADRPPPSFLRHQLHALEQLIDKTPIEDISADELLMQYGRTYRKGRRLMKQVAESRDDATLHRWRHRVKELYYQTLVFNHLAGARRRLRRSRRLGSLLGRDHDFTALAHEPAFRSRRSPWPDIIRERRDVLRQRCLALAHKLYAMHGSTFTGRLLCHHG